MIRKMFVCLDVSNVSNVSNVLNGERDEGRAHVNMRLFTAVGTAGGEGTAVLYR